MTSTIVRTFVTGETYPREEVYVESASWCTNRHGGYVCTLTRGHQGDHVGAMTTGEVVAVWDNPAPAATPLEAWKREVRQLAHTICDSRGYGDWTAWNKTMIRIGLEPFTQKRVRIVAPVERVVADLGSRYDEREAREWLASRRDSLATYLRPEEDRIGEPTVEVVEETPGADDAEKDPRADTDDLDEYQEFVREIAIAMGTEQSWCDDGVNGVLEELGLDAKTREYRIEVQIRAYQTVSYTVTARNESEALDEVDRSSIRDAISSYSWEWDGDWDSEDVSIEQD